jgi:hypothetical protein
MWIPDNEHGSKIVCDKCTEKEGTRCLQIGNIVIAELCSDCAGTFRADIESKLETKPGPASLAATIIPRNKKGLKR